MDLETDNLVILEQSYPNRLFYYKTNVCKEMQIHTAIADIIEKLQKADIVIHNACLCTFTKEADTDFSTYERVFDMNYYGALRLVKSILPYMHKQKNGKVICL